MELHESGNQIKVDEDNVEFFEALASKVRIRILQLLAIHGEMNLKMIANSLNLSSAITSMHINKLETSGLIVSNIVKKNGHNQRICTISDIDRLLIFPKHQYPHRQYYEVELGLGHYTNLNIRPTCGIITAHNTIGDFDNPVYFMDPQRIDAQMLWFGNGFIEYTIPNYISDGFSVDEISFSLELSSEAPGYMEQWPSDISFYISNEQICTWTCPGEFGGRKGYVSPEWWFADIIGQYGLLKNISINKNGTFIDGTLASNKTIAHLDLSAQAWQLRIGIDEKAINAGGVTIFGKEFGDFPQNILVRVYSHPVETDTSALDVSILYRPRTPAET